MLKGKYFWLRSIGASSARELITSIIADILAFFGTTNFYSVLKLMISIYSVKLLYSIMLALPSSLLVCHLKLKNGLFPKKTEININNFEEFTRKYAEQ